MSRALAVLVFALPLVAAAVEPDKASGVGADVARALAASLPSDMGLVDVVVPESLGRRRGTVAASWVGALREGPMTALVVTRDGGREVGRGYARVDVRKLREVLVTRRALRAGDRLVADDVEARWRPIAEGQGMKLAPDLLAGAAVTRDLATGALVTDADVARPAPLPRGTQVRVLVRRGVITVEATGTLERAARPGESAVAQLASASAGHRLVSGRLVDATTLVNEGEAP